MQFSCHYRVPVLLQSPLDLEAAAGLDLSEFVQNGIPMKMVTATNGAKIFLRPGTDVTAPTTGMWRHTYKPSGKAKVAPMEEVEEEDEYGLPIRKKAPKTALGDEVFQRPMWQVHSLWSHGGAQAPQQQGGAQAPQQQGAAGAAGAPGATAASLAPPGKGSGGGTVPVDGTTAGPGSGAAGGVPTAPDKRVGKPTPFGRQKVEQANGTLAVARVAPRAKLSLFAA